MLSSLKWQVKDNSNIKSFESQIKNIKISNRYWNVRQFNFEQ